MSLSSIAQIPKAQALKIGLGVEGGGASQVNKELGPSRPTPIAGAKWID